MPRWVQSGISNSCAALVRRYRLNAAVTEVLNAVLPVVQVDKHWQSDRLNLWGAFGQFDYTALGAGEHGAVMLVGADDRETLVHRVVANEQVASNIPDTHVHLFSPLQTYNPVLNGPTLYLPWLQGSVTPSDPAALSRAFVLSGSNPGQQVVVVNGVPQVSIGPVFNCKVQNVTVGALTSFTGDNPELWSFQDPPLRLLPSQTLAVQGLVPRSGPLAGSLNVSFFYSEREPQGNVG